MPSVRPASSHRSVESRLEASLSRDLKALRGRSAPFRLDTEFEPKGDQPVAIESLLAGLREDRKHQVLLGVTGSGKTFTIAKVIESLGRTTLVIAPNKTLAAQLFQEFRRFFPDNAVEYFVSYYDYYQPEAYVRRTDTYIEKEATINDEIDRLQALGQRRSVVRAPRRHHRRLGVVHLRSRFTRRRTTA